MSKQHAQHAGVRATTSAATTESEAWSTRGSAGPIIAGYGRAETGGDRFYVTIGKTF